MAKLNEKAKVTAKEILKKFAQQQLPKDSPGAKQIARLKSIDKKRKMIEREISQHMESAKHKYVVLDEEEYCMRVLKLRRGVVFKRDVQTFTHQDSYFNAEWFVLIIIDYSIERSPKAPLPDCLKEYLEQQHMQGAMIHLKVNEPGTFVEMIERAMERLDRINQNELDVVTQVD